MQKKILANYAELMIKVGVNLQKKEKLVIVSPIIAADLTREIVRLAYKNGASDVEVLWDDETVKKLDYKYKSKKTLSIVPEWAKMQRQAFVDDKVCYIVIVSDNPEAFKGINPEKIAVYRRAKNVAFAQFRDCLSSNKIRWSLAAYPNKAWAKKVFPDESSKNALKKLENAIISSVRLDRDNSLYSWENHNLTLYRRCEWLNNAKIKKFHFKNSLGTDFSVAMPKGYIFCGGSEKGLLDGVDFTANLPTEEVYSSPDRLSANGKLVASMPLCRNGQIIDKFWIAFKNGKVVDYGAEQGLENLKSIIESDDGSHFLGEIAFVSCNSPIYKQNLLFYETLFDENAGCHFALGDSYPNCYENGSNMTEEELIAAGLNVSNEHVDFVVGTSDLCVYCETESGKKLSVMENGEWVI